MWLLRTFWVWFVRGLGLERTFFVVLGGISIIVMVYWLFVVIDLLPDDPIIDYVNQIYTDILNMNLHIPFLFLGMLVDINYINLVITFLVLTYPAVLFISLLIKYITRGK